MVFQNIFPPGAHKSAVYISDVDVTTTPQYLHTNSDIFSVFQQDVNFPPVCMLLHPILTSFISISFIPAHGTVLLKDLICAWQNITARSYLTLASLTAPEVQFSISM
jgi:hypothetical protein